MTLRKRKLPAELGGVPVDWWCFGTIASSGAGEAPRTR
jgi:hypothetical protein